MKYQDRTAYLLSNKALFEATLQVFSSQSYDNASLNDIIRDSNSNKGSFYYRYQNKLDLYGALLDSMFVEQLSSINEAMLSIKEGQVLDLIHLLFDSLRQVGNIDARYFLLNHRFYNESTQFVEEVLAQCVDAPFSRIEVQLLRLGLNNLDIKLLRNQYVDFDELSDLDFFDYDGLLMRLHAIVSPTIHAASIQAPKVEDTIRESIRSVSIEFPSQTNQISAYIGRKDDSFQSFVNETLLVVAKDYKGFVICDDGIYNLDSRLKRKKISIPRFGKSLQTYLQRIKPWDQSDIDWLDMMSILFDSKLLTMKVKDVPKQFQIFVQLMKLCTYRPDFLFIEEISKVKNPDFLRRFSAFVLKYRDWMGKIVMIDHSLTYPLSIADHFSFIVDGHVISELSSASIQDRLSKPNYILTFLQDGVLHHQEVDQDELHDGTMKEILGNHPLIQVISIQHDLDQVFFLETGVTLNETFSNDHHQ